MSEPLRTTRRLFGPAVILAYFASYAPSAQGQMQTDVVDSQSALQKFGTCQLAVFNAPEFDPLRQRVPRSVFQATPEQLADTSLATDEEIRAVLLLHPRSRACYEELLGDLSRSAPSLAASYAVQFTKFQISLIDVLQRKQSWADHTRRSREAAIAGRTERSPGHPAAGSNLRLQDTSQQQAASDALAQFHRTEELFETLKGP